MRWFLTSAALIGLALSTVNPAEAAGRGGPSRGGNAVSNGRGNPGHRSNYHLEHGRQFGHGYFYPGKDHHHWSYHYWCKKYGCECYYCPSTCCWYYWYEPGYCYYPVSYIRTCPPAPVTQAAPVTVTATASASASAGGLPVAGPDGAPLPR